MSRNTIKAYENHTGRKSPGAQGVTFRDAAKPGLGPSRKQRGPCAELIREGDRFATTGCPECDEEIRTGEPCPVEGGHTCDQGQAQRLAACPADSNRHIRDLPTMPPPPASVEVSCLLARAQELEDTARMMLARAAELRAVAGNAKA